MNLDQLRALRAVATLGSMAAAAQALHLTPSAVSQQLAKLQRDLGVRLLQHEGRGVKLTDAGSLLAEHATQMLAAAERARADVQAAATTITGQLVLGAFASAARGVVPAALAALREHPRMSIELREMEMDQSVPLAVRGEIDVVVVNDWGTDPFTLPSALTAEHLGGDHFEVMLPEHHPAARRRQVRLAELAGETWIAWTRGSTYERWLVARLRSAGFDPHLGHYVEEHATQLALVATSLGVTLLPQVGRSPLPPGVVSRPTVPSFPRQLHAAYRTDDAYVRRSARRSPRCRRPCGARWWQSPNSGHCRRTCQDSRHPHCRYRDYGLPSARATTSHPTRQPRRRRPTCETGPRKESTNASCTSSGPTTASSRAWAAPHPLLVLHHVGARSGTERATPLRYLPAADGRYIIFGLNGGAPTNPAWYYLKANPQARVEVGHDTVSVHATEIMGEERDRFWNEQVAVQPQFSESAHHAGRIIPVIALAPVE